jgi:hypothetical protein
MTRLAQDPRLPLNGTQADFVRAMSGLLREYADQINGVSEGRADAFYNAATAAPTTGTYRQGDFIRNSAPTVLGTGGSQYVIHGWQCVASGTPGTWVQCRFLTGT